MNIDLPKAVVGVHVLVGSLFIGLGGWYLLQGDLAGTAIQVVLGLLLIAAGVAASRLL